METLTRVIDKDVDTPIDLGGLFCNSVNVFDTRGNVEFHDVRPSALQALDLIHRLRTRCGNNLVSTLEEVQRQLVTDAGPRSLSGRGYCDA